MQNQNIMDQKYFRARVDRIELALEERISNAGTKKSKINRRAAGRIITADPAVKSVPAAMIHRLIPCLIGVLSGILISITNRALFMEGSILSAGSVLGDTAGLVILALYPIALMCLIISLLSRNRWPRGYLFSLGLVTSMVVGALV